MLSIRQLGRPGLAPFDLDLADGECIALSGPSGAGKTTLLRAVADLDPAQGAVGLDGVTVYAAVERGRGALDMGFRDYSRGLDARLRPAKATLAP